MMQQEGTMDVHGSAAIAAVLGVSSRTFFYLLASNNPPPVYRLGRGKGMLVASSVALRRYAESRPHNQADCTTMHNSA